MYLFSAQRSSLTHLVNLLGRVKPQESPTSAVADAGFTWDVPT